MLNKKCPANNSTKSPLDVVLVHTRLSLNAPEADWIPQCISSRAADADTPGLSGAGQTNAMEGGSVGSDSDTWCLMEQIERSKGASSIGSMMAGLVKVEASSASSGEARKN